MCSTLFSKMLDTAQFFSIICAPSGEDFLVLMRFILLIIIYESLFHCVSTTLSVLPQYFPIFRAWQSIDKPLVTRSASLINTISWKLYHDEKIGHITTCLAKNLKTEMSISLLKQSQKEGCSFCYDTTTKTLKCFQHRANDIKINIVSF